MKKDAVDVEQPNFRLRNLNKIYLIDYIEMSLVQFDLRELIIPARHEKA